MAQADNNLFSIEEIRLGDGTVRARLSINRDCEILKGHFPGHAVVPGACMLGITKEVLQDALQIPLRLKKADQLKFMAMIDPANTLRVDLDISYKQSGDNSIIAGAKMSNPDTVYFKLQGSFERV